MSCKQDALLMVDGGSENNNTTVEEYLQGRPLKKLIALRDIRLSNSMVEAVNKIVKHSYLAGKTFHGLGALQATLSEAINDYNDNRPHISLKGLTPKEAHTGETSFTDKQAALLAEARAKRLAFNRQNRCYECL